MTEDSRLRVLIDARLARGSSGGVETVLMGLADGLAQVPGDHEFTFLVTEESSSWLAPRLGGNSRTLGLSRATASASLVSKAWATGKPMLPPSVYAGSWRARRRIGKYFPGAVLPSAPVDTSPFDVVHFPYQAGFRTAKPSIFQPHDLQHLHLPQFFSAPERARRAAVYKALCDAAALVVVGSRWVAQDVAASIEIDPAKIAVVNLAPVSRDVAPASGLERYSLPARFAYYPAATWAHKNHSRLLDAIARLRAQGTVVPLVFTGQITDHWRALDEQVRRLGLADLVHFLGFVPDNVVAALYERARLVVVPTLFEAGSFPVWEAFAAGTPVVCSSVTSLPEQAGDGAILFDPYDEAAMASAIANAWTQDAIRAQLVAAGRNRLVGLSWRETAVHMVAAYKVAAGRTGDQDLRLLRAQTVI